MLRKIILVGVFAYAYAAAAPSVNVTVKWKASPSCTPTAPQCRYIVSRVSLTGSACPVTTQNLYTPLNQQAPVLTLSYVDTVPKNSSWCYIVQTVQTQNNSTGISVPGALQKFVRVH